MIDVRILHNTHLYHRGKRVMTHLNAAQQAPRIYVIYVTARPVHMYYPILHLTYEQAQCHWNGSPLSNTIAPCYRAFRIPDRLRLLIALHKSDKDSARKMDDEFGLLSLSPSIFLGEGEFTGQIHP